MNQYFSKVSGVAKQISDLAISNNLHVGGTTIAGPINRSIIIPTATAAPSETNIIRITAEQSGTTFILTQNVGGFDQIFVLPPAAVGLNYTFTVQNATTGSKISIMPYGYTHSTGNPTAAGNGVAEAYAAGIQVISKVGSATAGHNTGAQSSQVNTQAGNDTAAQAASVGGIMFDTGVTAAATFTLICVSTSIAATLIAGCRWIGTGEMTVAAKIDETG